MSVSYWGDPYHEFCFIYHKKCGMYVRCKLCNMKNRQYRRYHVIFARKYKTLLRIKIPVATFNSNGTLFLEEKKVKNVSSQNFRICRKNCKSTCTSFLGHLNNSGKYSPLYDFCTFFLYFIVNWRIQDWMKKIICIYVH